MNHIGLHTLRREQCADGFGLRPPFGCQHGFAPTLACWVVMRGLRAHDLGVPHRHHCTRCGFDMRQSGFGTSQRGLGMAYAAKGQKSQTGSQPSQVGHCIDEECCPEVIERVHGEFFGKWNLRHCFGVKWVEFVRDVEVTDFARHGQQFWGHQVWMTPSCSIAQKQTARLPRAAWCPRPRGKIQEIHQGYCAIAAIWS